MKRIILSLSLIAVVGVVAFGATRAYFSSTASITGNTFSAGSLDLKVDQNPSSGTQDWVSSFDSGATFTDLYPGAVDHYPGAVDVKNVGTVDGTLNIKIHRTSAWSDLVNNLKFRIYYTNDAGVTNVYDSSLLKVNKLLSDADNIVYTLGSLPADTVGHVGVEWAVPTSAGNEIQGDSVTISVTFGLDQNH